MGWMGWTVVVVVVVGIWATHGAGLKRLLIRNSSNTNTDKCWDKIQKHGKSWKQRLMSRGGMGMKGWIEPGDG